MTDSAAGVLSGVVASGTAGPKAAGSTARGEAARDLETIYRTEVGFVWRVVRRCGVPSEAIEDLVHEVFLVVQRRLPELGHDEELRRWLYVISRGVVANDRRIRSRRERRHDGAPPPTSPPDPESFARGVEAIALVEGFLQTLGAEQRVVFELVDIEGWSSVEVASLTGAPLDTVYSRVRLARAAFARFVAATRKEAHG